jgi:hypothetical protein
MRRKDGKSTFSESLDNVERMFPHLSLDDQFGFIETYKPKFKALGDRFQRKIVLQLMDYLEKQMYQNLDDWLRSEMSR